jgi:hypothetical protein
MEDKKSLFLKALGIVYKHSIHDEYKTFDKNRKKKISICVSKKLKCISYIDLYQNYLRYFGFVSLHKLNIEHHEFYYKACKLCKRHLQIICNEDGMIYFRCLSCHHTKYNIMQI